MIRDVIIIDDEQGMRDILSDMLLKDGFEVALASSGEEGLTMLGRREFAVALVDIRLQDMSGIEILERMDQISPDTQIILMTAHASVDTAIKAVRGRAYDYISKPFSQERLLEAVRGAADLYHLKAQNRKMLRYLRFVSDITGEIVGMLDASKILETVLTRTVDFLKVEAGAVYTSTGARWKLRASMWAPEKFIRRFSVLERGHPLVRNASHEGVSFVGKLSNGEGELPWASVPLTFGREVLGIMLLAGQGAGKLDDQDSRFLTILGAQTGAVLHNVLLFQDVDRAKRRLQQVLDNTGDAIITYDPEARVQSWNPAATEIFGFNEKEVLGGSYPPLPEDRQEEGRQLLERVRRGEVVRNLETERMTKDGRRVTVAMTLAPVRDHSGKVTGISSIWRDLTLRKEMERERLRFEILRAQGRIREVLIDVIPLLLNRRLPQQDRNDFIQVLSKRLEEALYDDYVGEINPTPESIAESIARAFNDMGGDFHHEIENGEIHIIGRRCPWGNETRKNPISCMLTRGICTRFARRALGEVRVDMESTLANRDDCCRVVIRV